MPKGSRRRQRREITDQGEYYFDKDAADIAESFFSRYCRHIKGRLAGRPFILEPWQRDRIIRPFFGWKRVEDGLRRYRTCYIEIPKKNGKSTLGAGVGLYATTADGEPGAEVYSAAGDKDQARIVFNLAGDMRDASPGLTKRTTRYQSSIVHHASASSYRVLSSDSFTKHGLNPHAILFDELHVQPNRDLWDTLTTGVAGRSQPMTFAMTTAGFDRDSICWEIHEYAEKVRDGVIKDDKFLPVIYGTKETEDWQDPKVWKKANPNLGVSVTWDYFRDACKRAKDIPAFENTFRRLHLNQWTQQLERWIQLRVWDASAGIVDAGALEGLPCWAGLDMASTIDIAALVLTFHVGDAYKWLPFFWIPEARMRERIARDKVPYDVWAREGLIKVTPGDVIDYKEVIHDILEIRKVYDLREVAYDRWGAAKIAQDLMDEGLTVVPFGQGFASMSPPTKELMTLLISKKMHHGSHAVLRWMANNVMVKEDPSGNIKPDKSKSRHKIDGIVAGIMGLDRAIRHGSGEQEKSVYEEEGIKTI